jgi:hypothetical protein
MKLSIALTDATSAVPGLRGISVVVPQARALSAIKNDGHWLVLLRRIGARRL